MDSLSGSVFFSPCFVIIFLWAWEMCEKTTIRAKSHQNNSKKLQNKCAFMRKRNNFYYYTYVHFAIQVLHTERK